jgi:ABC-type Fe3+-siderophore transport system permease subunit
MNRTVVAMLLLLGGLLGLFMTFCGTVVSIGLVADQASRQYAGALILSLPSLILGVLLLWFVWRKYQRFRAPEPPPPPPSPPFV